MRTQMVILVGLLIGADGSVFAQEKPAPSPLLPHTANPQVQKWLQTRFELSVSAQVAEARRIGLQTDRTKSQALVDWLFHPPDYSESYLVSFGFTATRKRHLYTAILTALGRLGDPSTLPKLQALEPKFGKEPFFRANFARLQAEVLFSTPTTDAQWRHKVEVYLQAVGLSREALKDYFEKERVEDRVRSGELPSLEMVVVRHLVEMAVEAYGRGVRSAFAELAGIAYERDPVNALRMELMRVPPDKRVAWLIERIARLPVYTAAENYLVQALIDCGVSAVPVIREAVERYASDKQVGKRELLWALSAIEFWQGCPSLHELANHPEPAIAEEARRLLSLPLVVRASDW